MGAEIRRENQLRLVVYPIIYQGFYIPTGAGFPNHQQYHLPPSTHFFGWQPVSSGSSQANAILLVVVLVTFTLRGTPGNLAGDKTLTGHLPKSNQPGGWMDNSSGIMCSIPWLVGGFNPSEKY